MKKLYLFLIASLFIMIPMNAQNNNQEYSVFVVVTFEEHMDNYSFTLNIDDGKTISTVKNEKGKNRRFRTVAAALTYFESLGWKLSHVGVSKKDNDDFTYWIFKKPVSKEEYYDIVNNAIE